MIVRWNNVAVGLVLILSSAIPGGAAVRLVPAEYPTIQAAVDVAASDDVIRIAPGVYTNQVVITNSNLTLSGPGAVLRATPGMQQSLMPAVGTNATAVPLVAIFESTNVVVSGLTLEGERLADSQPGSFIGMRFLAAGGRVEDCRIMGFRGNNIDSTNEGQGIAIANPHRFGVGQINLDVLRSTFADNASSIVLKGDVPSAPPNTNWNPGLLSTTFTVNDNLIVGNGPDETGAQFGIWIWAGAGGEVRRNTITDFSFTGDYSFYNNSKWALGVLANDAVNFGTTNAQATLQLMHFEGNIFRTNQIHMALIRADGSTIVNNSFEGTAPGYRPAGLVFTGDGVWVATNRFSDMDTGILLLGDDFEWGTYLGIASNATLIENGFCNVATNYVLEPLTTYSPDPPIPLICPWPILDIHAVRLSWPYSYNGYSVQIAPAVNGPWPSSDATPFLQNAQNNVVMPADGDQQFFRLMKP